MYLRSHIVDKLPMVYIIEPFYRLGFLLSLKKQLFVDLARLCIKKIRSRNKCCPNSHCSFKCNFLWLSSDYSVCIYFNNLTEFSVKLSQACLKNNNWKNLIVKDCGCVLKTGTRIFWRGFRGILGGVDPLCPFYDALSLPA